MKIVAVMIYHARAKLPLQKITANSVSVVAIVGRPNVGKSTLFNRLVAGRQAITDNQEGITRDRHYGECEWNNRCFTVIDTGGYVSHRQDVFQKAILEQIRSAIAEADCILFVLDAKVGIQSEDREIARELQKLQRSVFVVANKVDNPQDLFAASEFYGLGCEKLYTISASSGSGTGDLLDDLTLRVKEETAANNSIPKVAVIGKPNVGKSSLVNALMSQNRTIVTPIPGTTRDAIDSHYRYFGKELILIDTAGVRRKSKTKESIEFYSTLRTLKAIERSDVCLLLIDATEEITSQDLTLLQHVQKRNKGIVIVLNKWDLIAKDSHSAKAFTQRIKERTLFSPQIPILLTSVLKKQRIFEVVKQAIQVYENKIRKIKTSELNSILLPIIEKNTPPASRGREIKIKYITQAAAPFPIFIFFCNYPRLVQDSYKRYLLRQIHKHFGFGGVFIKLLFKNK